MRIRRKNKQPGMPPAQVEALGRLSPAEFAQINERNKLGMPPVQVEAQAMTAAARFFKDRGLLELPDVAAAQAKERSAKRSDDAKREAKIPLLIGGESPQETQTGESHEYTDSIVIDRNNTPVIRPGVRCITGQKVGIDWVSCVFETSETWRYFFVSGFDQEKLLPEGEVDFNHSETSNAKTASYIKSIFGWILGFTKSDDESNKWKIFENGLNGYAYAVGMPFRAGVVHVGHTSGTVLVTVTGQGALVASPGWEKRLVNFLKDVRGWLTRIDMAFDDYEGEYFPVRVMRQKANDGAFQRGGHPPKIELRGSWDQDDPNNSGLTLYVGSRMSGKFTRIYEKGKQLGKESSPWVRAEVELHNSCYQLTLEMLVNPSGWFVAFYPCFEVIQYAGNRQELEYRSRIATQTVEKSLKWIRHQAGGHLAGLRELYDDTELLDLLVRSDAIPELFLTADKSCQAVLAPSACLTEEPGWIEA